MQILMGGSGSTGSSLLKNILNRHPDVFAGGETAFFAKRLIYKNWDKAKSRVLRRKLYGLKNHGWHIYNGSDLVQDGYGWNKNELQSILLNSNSLFDFVAKYYDKSFNHTGSKIWLEKTPANSACFSFFLDSFEDGKVIHMVRNPYDTIASLVNRGYNLYYAIGIYLLNTASGISVDDIDRVFTMKYEDLIQNPESTVKELCHFLNLEYSPDMLKPQGEKVSLPKLKGWHYDETKAIGTEAVGRFNKLSVEQQDEIKEAVNMVYINKKGKQYYSTEICSIKDICSKLNYDYYPTNKSSSFKKLNRLKRKDRFMRLARNYPTGLHYPLSITK